jgi:thioredoxin 1
LSILEISEANIDALLAREGILVIDAWAAWCGPCRQFAPVFDQAAANHPEHTFGKLDTEADEKLVEDLGIRHIPTLLIYRDGILLYRKAGSPKSEVLEDLIDQVEKLDMDAVRADLAARKAGTAEAGGGSGEGDGSESGH